MLSSILITCPPTRRSKLAIIANWRTSSYTSSDSCVEVADNDPAEVLIRDTKNREYGHLSLHSDPWTAFIEATKRFPV
ncbi:DUF397 domain-containing protein [Streptomyces sp. NPDC091280]|uniref:DUF397 domain-containing protein n=1 Tax=Streptomyces sp. NPDC091280 TaxID=3365984 RepID=UPI00380A2C77